MPSSWSPNLRFELQFDGENTNTWGDKLDVVLNHIDFAIAGFETIALTGNYALTTANAADDQARAAMIKFTGAGPFTVTLPSVSKRYLIWNATGGLLTLTTGAGATLSIDPGDRTNVDVDGSNVSTIMFGGMDLKTFISSSALAATGTLPALAGNAGKYVKTDGVNAFWAAPASTDLSDYQTNILGVQVALAIAL